MMLAASDDFPERAPAAEGSGSGRGGTTDEIRSCRVMKPARASVADGAVAIARVRQAVRGE
jgi:hypothetical protein